VPELRERVLSGQSGRLAADLEARLHGAMHRFESAILTIPVFNPA